MVDYSKLSDFEINKRIALALGFDLYKDGKSCQKNHVAIQEGRSGAFTMDWCNNPADAWLIIVKNKIGVRNISGDLWECASPDGMKADYSSRPLRSSMIVFLMMQEKE